MLASFLLYSIFNMTTLRSYNSYMCDCYYRYLFNVYAEFDISFFKDRVNGTSVQN